MAFPKEERNRQFIEAWKVGRLSNEELAQKYRMSTGGVKALKQRLRKKHPDLYENGQASKPVSQQASKMAEYKKVTYYLDPDMAKSIKRLALEEDRDISAFIREILNEYLTRHKTN